MQAPPTFRCPPRFPFASPRFFFSRQAPPIFILDEATSALDSLTEKEARPRLLKSALAFLRTSGRPSLPQPLTPRNATKHRHHCARFTNVREQQVQASLAQLRRGATVLVVAHR